MRAPLADLFQRDKAGSLRATQAFESGGNENAIFANERNKVGNTAKTKEAKEIEELNKFLTISRVQVHTSGGGPTGARRTGRGAGPKYKTNLLGFAFSAM